MHQLPSSPLPLWPDLKAPENPTLTPFLIPGDRIRAAVVVCPGGGYAGRAEHEGAPIARWLNSLGLHAFVCDYRVTPARHPAPLDDVQRAVRLVREHAAQWRVDDTRVGLLGFSAGGHLACSAGNLGDDGDFAAADPVARQRGRPDLVIGCYPVITSGTHLHRGSFDNLLGERPDPTLLHLLSLENSVGPRNPPTFLWSTADDQAVPVENSLLYALALRKHGVPLELHVYPHGRHGLGLASEDGIVSDWSDRCAQWLTSLGWR